MTREPWFRRGKNPRLESINAAVDFLLGAAVIALLFFVACALWRAPHLP